MSDSMEKPVSIPSLDSHSSSPLRRVMRIAGRAAGCVAVLISSALGAAEFRPVKGEPGLSYKNEKVSSEPWSIHVLRVDRAQKDLAVYSAHARDKVLGVSLLAD